MKTTILTLFILTGFVNAKAQDKATIKGDTLYYAGAKYYVNKIITFGYGSGTDKEFVFVKPPTLLSGSSTAFLISKRDATIISLQMNSGKAFIKAIYGKLKLTIDIEGAMDNREVIK